MEKRVLYILLTVFSVVLLIGFVIESRLWWQSKGGPSRPKADQPLAETFRSPKIIFTDPTLGPATAPVTIVEFGDYTCEACVEAQSELKKAASEFPGLVRIIWKDFPINLIRPEALSAAVAARCAARQGRFAEYQDALFRGKGLLGEEFFSAVAKSLNLNNELFDQCRQDPKVKQEVLASRQEGIDLGIDGVPYFFLEEQRINEILSGELWTKRIRIVLDNIAQY